MAKLPDLRGKIFMLQTLMYLKKRKYLHTCVVFLTTVFLFAGCVPKEIEPIVLRKVKDVVVHASSEPMLKGKAILYNPNDIGVKLRKVKVDVFINDKKTGEIDQKIKMQIPPNAEFTVPLEVKLAMEELNLVDTVLGMLGGRKLNVHYKGSIKITYRGLPMSVPVDYKSEIRVKI